MAVGKSDATDSRRLGVPTESDSGCPSCDYGLPTACTCESDTAQSCGCDYELVEDGAVHCTRWSHEPGCIKFDPQCELYDRFVRRGEEADPFNAKRLYPGLASDEALKRIARLRDGG